MENLGWNTLLVALIGMVVVFLGLVLLIALINIMGKLTGGMGQKEAPKAAPAPAAAPVAVAAPAVVKSLVKPDAEVRPASIDSQTLAVLTAAIAATRGEGYPFKIRRIVRVNRG